MQAAPKADALTLGDAVIRGLKADAGKLAAKALETEDELSLVENHLIPALDKVGEDYDKGTAFLPQLLSAAQAAQLKHREEKKSRRKVRLTRSNCPAP